ncbi:MAG: hypothetical protein ACRD3M_06270 [Thermoanaerobaculia bacterium]
MLDCAGRFEHPAENTSENRDLMLVRASDVMKKTRGAGGPTRGDRDVAARV